jgi:hypothetical protein
MDKFEPKFTVESEDLSEDHVYSYQKKIHGLIDKYNTAIKNEFVVMAWHKILPGLWFAVERVKSIVQFHKEYYKSKDYECLYYGQYQDWPNYGVQLFFENVRGNVRKN